MILRDRGDVDSAEGILAGQLEVLGQRFGVDHSRVRLVRALAGQTALDRGRLQQAETLAQAFHGQPNGPHEYLFLARLDLVRGRAQQAVQRLADWEQLTQGPLRQRLRLEGQLWRALAEREATGRLPDDIGPALVAASRSTPRLAALAQQLTTGRG